MWDYIHHKQSNSRCKIIVRIRTEMTDARCKIIAIRGGGMINVRL